MKKPKNSRKPKHPALKPHYETNDYNRGVVVLRVPEGTPPAEANKALNWARNLAKKFSNPDPWW